MVTYNDIYERYPEIEINRVTQDITFNIYDFGYLKQYHRYKIIKVGLTTDFTIVGSPDNEVGTKFQANTSLVEPIWDGGELQTGKTQIEYIDEYLDNARTDLAGYANLAKATADEANQYQKEFLVCWTMALLYEMIGLTDKANALKNDGLKALYAIWGSIVYTGNEDPTSITTAKDVTGSVAKPDFTDFDAQFGFGL
jgi:hypothetical protein